MNYTIGIEASNDGIKCIVINILHWFGNYVCMTLDCDFVYIILISGTHSKYLPLDDH